jgi:hypothetical protein
VLFVSFFLHLGGFKCEAQRNFSPAAFNRVSQLAPALPVLGRPEAADLPGKTLPALALFRRHGGRERWTQFFIVFAPH